MDNVAEEQLDYDDDEYGGSKKLQYQGSGAISALVDEELMGEEDEYDDLYNDVNVGEGFMQSMHHQNEMHTPLGLIEKDGDKSHKVDNPRLGISNTGASQEVKIPGVVVQGKDSNAGQTSFSNMEQRQGSVLSNNFMDNRKGMAMAGETPAGNVNYRGSAPIPTKTGNDYNQGPGKFVGGPSSLPNSGAQSGPTMAMVPALPVMNRPIVNDSLNKQVLGSMENGTNMIFVGELHWWTTDAELESVLSQYGRVKEIKFFDERASGKSKGYCQVEFYEASAAAACKEGMNGYVFNGRPCVVAFASSQTLKQMGAAYFNKNQVQAQSEGRRPLNEGVGRGGGMNYQRTDGGRNFGRVGWGRGGQGLLNRGQGGGGPMRGRGSIGGRGMVGTISGASGGGPYGQGLAMPGLGGPAGGMMHPQGMVGAGFDPTYMGRGAGYGGFASPAFPGMMHTLPAINTVGLSGVAPHVNPAFFGRGIPNGMGMMGSIGMDGSVGMWTDTSMTGWGDEHGRTRESSYGGDDGTSDHGYGEPSHERGGRTSAFREKERVSERDRSGISERRHHDDRDMEWDRSERERNREDKDGHRDHPRLKDRDWDNEDYLDRGHASSGSRSTSRRMQEVDHRSRSRDADHGKRRRPPSE